MNRTPLTRTEKAEHLATATAHQWAAGDIGKWAAYGRIFHLVDRRRITLTKAVEILETEIGIRPEVTRMRRHDYLAMRSR